WCGLTKRHAVEARGGVDKPWGPAGPGRPQTQKPYDIAGISMIGLALAGLIDANTGIKAGQAGIPDMAENMTLGVLRAQAPQMSANPQKGNRGFVLAPSSYWQSADQHEPSSIQDFVEKRP